MIIVCVYVCVSLCLSTFNLFSRENKNTFCFVCLLMLPLNILIKLFSFSYFLLFFLCMWWLRYGFRWKQRLGKYSHAAKQFGPSYAPPSDARSYLLVGIARASDTVSILILQAVCVGIVSHIFIKHVPVVIDHFSIDCPKSVPFHHRQCSQRQVQRCVSIWISLRHFLKIKFTF